MNLVLRFGVVLWCALAGAVAVFADPLRNPVIRDCDPTKDQECMCDSGITKITNGCVQITLDLGRTSRMSGSRQVSLKLLEMAATPEIFTPAHLNLVLGYTFKYVGGDRSSRNVPQEVVFADSNGEAMTFRFAEGSSLAACTAQSSMNQLERLQMVDAEGWATAEDPAYYDLYPGDGTVWRFYATDVTGRLGELVSHTDARGKVTTLEEFGVEVVRGSYGQIRQVLAPSRLADVAVEREDKYVVSVYPIVGRPEMEEGVYVVPQTTPVYVLSIEREAGDDHRLLARLKKGSGAFREYRYRYHPDVFDWELTFPNGNISDKAIMHGENDDATLESIQRTEAGMLLTWKKSYFEDFGWGLVKTSKKEGRENGPQRVTTWDYVKRGVNKGRVASTTDYRGNQTDYEYDGRGRIVRESLPAVGRETVFSYAPVDQADVLNGGAGVAAVVNDTRPRCEVKYEKDPETEAMVEVSRTYSVYSPTQEIVERAATAGAAYGAAGALRTVRTWYAPDDATPYSAGRLKSIRSEDGTLRVYTYGLDDDRWIETVTQLHEQALEPVSGKTTRSSVVYDRVGNVVERNQEAFIDGAWHLIDRTVYEYDIEGHVIKETDFAGRVTTTVWGGSCCGKTSMTLPDGTRFTYTYDAEGRLIAETKLDPLPCTTHTEYDELGRVVKTWKDGLNPETTAYDVFGQVISQTDVRGGVTQTAYSLDGNTVTTTFPNGGTQIRKTDAIGRLLEVSGTAVQPQVFAYGPLWERVATGARWQQTEHNLLGQSVRQTRSGANGSTLETLTAYDDYGRVAQITAPGQPIQSFTYAPTGEQTTITKTVGEVWRKQDSDSTYLFHGGNIWLHQATQQSCSDVTIVPLTQQNRLQLSGLSVTNTINQIIVDVRGNETHIFGNDTLRITQLPSCTNSQTQRYAFGQLIASVDTACVTNRFEYDALDRRVAVIDGRNNRTVYAYDAKDNLVSATDAVGAVTAYGYDVMGQTVAVTNALGNVTVYEYDLRGNKTYEGGAVYPVRYTYDVFGNKVSMTTYRNEASGVGDTTTWTYDEASGALLEKAYMDGKKVVYTYTNLGDVVSRRSARGILTEYGYDAWGRQVSVTYSDGTPSISYEYDAFGRQTSITDASGTTIFSYNVYGDVVRERNLNTLERHYDVYGRDVGYSLNDTRKQDITYSPVTGRIVSANGFSWEYLPGTNLKSKVIYPNGCEVELTYEAKRELLVTYKNSTCSEYNYVYDILRRKSSKNGESYEYNVRDELIAYDMSQIEYDDIGNRISAGTLQYQVNEVNQYTKIGEFIPLYDDDGNQTKIQTSTGIWNVTYNAENRPILWEKDGTQVRMSFDRMGRRVSMDIETEHSVTRNRYTYKDFLCIQQNTGTTLDIVHEYVWDPTEKVNTRPLAFSIPKYNVHSYYLTDGHKNITGLISRDSPFVQQARYDYTALGEVREVVNYDDNISYISLNPYRFSSEMYDDELGLVYYNFRHYNPLTAAWSARDLLEEFASINLYCFLLNNAPNKYERLGALAVGECEETSGSFSSSINIPVPGTGGMSFDISREIQVTKCAICCASSSTGKSLEITTAYEVRTGMSASWDIPLNLWGISFKVPVGYSFSIGGGERSVYNGCSKKKVTTGCNTISISVSAGVCVKPVPVMRFCLNGAFTYTTTNCNEHNIAQSEISGSLSLSACYSLFGLGDACMSVDLL